MKNRIYRKSSSLLAAAASSSSAAVLHPKSGCTKCEDVSSDSSDLLTVRLCG